MSDITDMPTAEELRMMLRSLLTSYRNAKDELAIKMSTFSDWDFIHSEMMHLKRLDIWEEENRRHELIKRGYTPPDDLSITRLT